MRRVLIVIPAVLALLVAWSLPVHSTPTITRYPIVSGHDDAWQRGVAGAMHADDQIVFLGRSDSDDYKFSGGFRFVTTIPANTVVRSAFVQAFNDWGAQLRVVWYGDMTPGAPNFDAANPSIVERPRTAVGVSWDQSFIQNRHPVSSPDLAPIINYLDRQPGWDGTVVFLAIAGGGSDRSIDIRAFEHPVGPAAVLEVQS